MFLFAHHKRRIRLVRRVSMKHLIEIGVLIAMDAPSENRSTKSADGRMATEAAGSKNKEKHT